MNQELLSQIQDIEGLDLISCWPLALGWWLIIGASIILIIIGIWLYWRHWQYKKSWLYPIYLKLSKLEKNVTQDVDKIIINDLSECLRQIAVKKYPRETCAGLSGTAWLTWLTQHDPKNFNWLQYGQPLILGAYAPKLANIKTTDLKKLIQAAKRWVK